MLGGVAGPLGLWLVAVVSLSFVQSWFLLELKPLWARGILRYGYRDPTFAQVLPVISASVRRRLPLLEGTLHESSVLALPPGPLPCQGSPSSTNEEP